MTPHVHAWHHLGRPAIDVGLTACGTCALCGTDGPTADARKVVSTNFDGWDHCRWRGAHDRPMFCGACTWALRRRDGRRWPAAVTADAVILDVSPDELRHQLGTVPFTAAVSVPVGGQKHLVPWLAWGCVSTDHGVHPWGLDDTHRLAVTERLRAVGFGEAALGERAPRWAIIRKLDISDRQWVMAHWADLGPWRHDRPILLDVACRATRRPKEPARG